MTTARIACVLFLLVGATAFGQVLTVPDQHATIQGALNAVGPMGTVWVRPGFYKENIQVPAQTSIRGILGPAGQKPLLVPDNPALPVISAGAQVGAGTLLSNLRISNGRAARGAGILLQRGSMPRIQDCDITKNRGEEGAGIFIMGPGGTEIERCLIADNEASVNGGGIFIDNLQTMTWLRDNTILRNHAGNGGGGVFGDGHLYGLEDNQLMLNTARYGAGLYQDRADNVAIVRNLFQSNAATVHGGGAFLYRVLGGEYEGNVFARNVAQSHGGGFYSFRSTDVLLEDTTIEENAAWRGAGGYIYASNMTLNGGRIADNTAAWQGGGIAVRGSGGGLVTLTRLRLHRNSAFRGGGLFAQTHRRILVTNCVFNKNGAASGGGVDLLAADNPTFINDTFVGNKNAAGALGEAIRASGPVRLLVMNSWLTEHASAVSAMAPGALAIVTHCALFANGADFNGPVMEFRNLFGQGPWFTDFEFFRTAPGDVGSGQASDAHPDAPAVDIDLRLRGQKRDIGVSER